MKRLMISLVVLGVFAAPAGAGASRSETYEYTGAGQIATEPVTVWTGPMCVNDSCVGGIGNIETLKTERAVKVKIADASGTSVRGVIVQGRAEHEFCGSSRRVPIKGGKTIAIFVSANPCSATPEGVPTSGTVTATFFD